MKLLKGKIMQEGKTIKSMDVPYNNERDFFLALVRISYELGIDVPIWTSKEDKLLMEENQVSIVLERGTILKVFRELA